MPVEAALATIRSKGAGTLWSAPARVNAPEGLFGRAGLALSISSARLCRHRER